MHKWKAISRMNGLIARTHGWNYTRRFRGFWFLACQQCWNHSSAFNEQFGIKLIFASHAHGKLIKAHDKNLTHVKTILFRTQLLCQNLPLCEQKRERNKERKRKTKVTHCSQMNYIHFSTYSFRPFLYFKYKLVRLWNKVNWKINRNY